MMTVSRRIRVSVTIVVFACQSWVLINHAISKYQMKCLSLQRLAAAAATLLPVVPVRAVHAVTITTRDTQSYTHIHVSQIQGSQ